MLKLSGLCLIALVALAVIGEQILPLYGGDVALAARGSKASFAALGGLAFAFAQPAIWRFCAARLQAVIAIGGSDARLAKAVLQPGFRSGIEGVARLLCALFAVAALALSYLLWTGRV